MLNEEYAKQRLGEIKRRLMCMPLRRLIDFAAYVALEHAVTAALVEPEEQELYFSDLITEAAEYAELDLDAVTKEGGKA